MSMREAIEAERRANQLILSGGLLYGAFWATDGIEGSSRTDATSLIGLQVGTTQGMGTWALEGGLVGAWTGDARFDGVTIDEMPGDLTRSARMLRGTLGGVVRVGDMIAPTVRFGAGVQVTRYKSQLMTDGTPTGESDSSVEVSGLWYIAAGVELRLGDQFVLGIAGAYERMVDNNSKSLQLGVHGGWGWDR